MIGFVLFALAGFVFGYAAPKAWAFLPVGLPIVVGLYTGFQDTFDGELLVLIALAVGITIGGVLLGRLLAMRTEGGRAAA